MRAKLPVIEGLVDSDGVKISYEVYGSGSQTILFLPTWALITSRNYKAQIPYFSEQYRCITFDPRGNGKSDKPETASEHGLSNFVNDALAVMEATGTQKAVMFGYSCSGPVCAALAAFHPERVEAVVTVAANSPLSNTFDYKNMDVFSREYENNQGWEKYNGKYWETNYDDFADFFLRQIFSEPHSTKQIEDGLEWSKGSNGAVLNATMGERTNPTLMLDEEAYRSISCPMLVIHGDADRVTPYQTAEKIADITGCELVIIPGAGHAPHGRLPAKVNLLMRDFLNRVLSIEPPKQDSRTPKGKKAPKALYLSSPIGLGHVRRDLAITNELRKLHPNLEVNWLSQDPVTRFLSANNESIHPASMKLANETNHIESEAGEHDLNAFQAIRNMDEILIANFMVFQEVLEQGDYDLVIADEAWEVDQFWHEHPELKKTQMAWLTDFVGFVPMPEGGAREAELSRDYNAEMLGHIDRNPGLRDRSIFVGNPGDIIPHSFGKDLPDMGEWIGQKFDFSGYVLGQHPDQFGDKNALRSRLGYRTDEKVCVVTVGGSGVGGALIRRILAAYPIAKRNIPELRMIVVTGPRLNPASFDFPDGVEARSFVPDLNHHLAACDLALVQGGLTTTMELTAAGTPFIFFPLKNHFEQNFHVARRLDQYKAGRKMIYDESCPDRIAKMMVEELLRSPTYRPVESDGAMKAARMLSDLL